MNGRNGTLSKSIAAVALSIAGIASPALAGDGHDHGEAPAARGGPALPRFHATSDAFELVGVVDGKNLRVWLDRFEDNAPVRGASVELDVGGTKVALQEHAEGEFEGVLAAAPASGVTPITATVTAGTVVDLLAADLDIHAETLTAAAAPRDWMRIAGWSAAGLVVLTLLVFAGRRAVAPRRKEGTA